MGLQYATEPFLPQGQEGWSCVPTAPPPYPPAIYPVEYPHVPPPPPVVGQPFTPTMAMGYPPPQPCHQAPETVVLCSHSLVSNSELVVCGHCRKLVTPTACKESGACTWFTAASMCLFGCWLCAWFPFCFGWTKDTIYACPHCKAELNRIRAPR